MKKKRTAEQIDGIIVLIVKKGKGTGAEKYRKVTLTQTAYKVFTTLLAERQWDKVKGKAILPQNQTDFRREMGTIDNNCVLSYLINRQIKKTNREIIIIL